MMNKRCVQAIRIHFEVQRDCGITRSNSDLDRYYAHPGLDKLTKTKISQSEEKTATATFEFQVPQNTTNWTVARN